MLSKVADAGGGIPNETVLKTNLLAKVKDRLRSLLGISGGKDQSSDGGPGIPCGTECTWGKVNLKRALHPSREKEFPTKDLKK